MLTIACVYKSGGDFDLTDVCRLALSADAHVTAPYHFVCLTDVRSEFQTMTPDGKVLDIDTIPLMNNWPGWWAKMQLFALAGPVVYFDLDTLIVGKVDELCKWAAITTNDVLMLRGFYQNDHCSGIMVWNRDMSWLYHRFGALAMNASWRPLTNGIGCANYRGDQEYIREQLSLSRVPIVVAQDVQPGIYSYKVHIQKTGVVPADASVVCFHGRPRPNEINLHDLTFEGATR